MWTFEKRIQAWATEEGEDFTVTIPDQIYADQRHHDAEGTEFPIMAAIGGGWGEFKARLDGDAYGLNTPGTGDPRVIIVGDA